MTMKTTMTMIVVALVTSGLDGELAGAEVEGVGERREEDEGTIGDGTGDEGEGTGRDGGEAVGEGETATPA